MIAAQQDSPEEVVFDTWEVSAIYKNDMQHGRFLTRGQLTGCLTEPDKEVKTYPKLQSKHPLYGKIKIYTNPAKKEGIEYHFVLDESGEEANKEQKKDAEKKEGPSLWDSLSEKLFGPSGAAGQRRNHVLFRQPTTGSIST